LANFQSARMLTEVADYEITCKKRYLGLILVVL
jgi:hypothetical protein